MAESEEHVERKHEIVTQYKADQAEFVKTLKRVSVQAFDQLQTSPRLFEGNHSLWKQQAAAIVKSGVYFPQSAMLYLKRCIRLRKITSWYYKLDLPFSLDEASGNEWKEMVNQDSKVGTASHEYHTGKLKKLKKTLEKCANLADSRPTSLRDDIVCRQHFPDNDLEEVFTQQRTYLMERRDRLRPEPVQTAEGKVRGRQGSVGDLYPELVDHCTSEYAHLMLVKA